MKNGGGRSGWRKDQGAGVDASSDGQRCLSLFCLLLFLQSLERCLAHSGFSACVVG